MIQLYRTYLQCFNKKCIESKMGLINALPIGTKICPNCGGKIRQKPRRPTTETNTRRFHTQEEREKAFLERARPIPEEYLK